MGENFKNVFVYFYSVASSSSVGQWKLKRKGILCDK
jgi:hypothetical protein